MHPEGCAPLVGACAGAPRQGASHQCLATLGIRFAQTPWLLSGDAFSVMKEC